MFRTVFLVNGSNFSFSIRTFSHFSLTVAILTHFSLHGKPLYTPRLCMPMDLDFEYRIQYQRNVPLRTELQFTVDYNDIDCYLGRPLLFLIAVLKLFTFTCIIIFPFSSIFHPYVALSYKYIIIFLEFVIHLGRLTFLERNLQSTLNHLHRGNH